MRLGESKIQVIVSNRDMENMHVNHINWKGPQGSTGEFAKNTVKDFRDYQRSISFVADFYKHLTEKYSNILSKEAFDLAESAVGKRIRSAKEAIKSFDKYKGVLNKKFSVVDRAAIVKALESLEAQTMAIQLKIFGKAFGIVGGVIQWGAFASGVAEGIQTGNWKKAIIAGESIIASKLAASLVVFAFSAMAISPIGILGFSAIMAVTGALISDEKLESINCYIMSI